MWVIFNPTAEDLNCDINFKKWILLAGEAKKFPNEIGAEMINLYSFLEVLDRDDKQPKVTFKPPKSVKNVKEAIPEEIHRDRKITHPSSDPKVKATGGFSGAGEMDDEKAGLPPTYREATEQGKLMSFDKDNVGWYGDGISVDNPLSKD